MKQKPFIVRCATLGPIGSFKGSGTLASLLALPLAYFLYVLELPLWIQILLTCSLAIGGFKICRHALAYFRRQDPPEIVVDEVIGCLITFCGVPMDQWGIVILGILLFRFFDISKIGIASFERLNQAWGVVLDDVMAGLISNIVVQLAILILI